MMCAILPLVQAVTMWPGTGETNAPLDTVAIVTYRGSSPALATPGLAIEDANQAVVPSTVTELPSPGPDRHVFRIVPDQPLAPGAQYYVADSIDWSCSAEPCTTALTVKHLFTTGTDTDTTAPPVPPAPVVASQTTDASDPGCDPPYHALLTSLANPATGARTYDLYDDGALVETDAPFLIATDCPQASDGMYPFPSDAVALAAGTHHLTWHGIDSAGNESAGTEALPLTLDCSAISLGPDAGAGEAPDAGSGGGMPADGCGCRTSGGTGWLFLAIPAAFVLPRRLRRS